MDAKISFSLHAHFVPHTIGHAATIIVTVGVYRNGLHVKTFDITDSVVDASVLPQDVSGEQFAAAAARFIARMAEDNLELMIRGEQPLHTARNIDDWYPSESHSTKAV